MRSVKTICDKRWRRLPIRRNYAGILPLQQSAKIIANALGTRGTCHEYVALLAQALDDYGLDDPETQALHVEVQRHLAEMS